MHSSFEKIFHKTTLDLSALIRSFEHLSDEQINTPMQKNKWSIAQTMYHINESIEKTLRYIQKKIQYPETIEKTNFYTTVKSFLLNTTLRTDIKMKAPKGVVTLIPDHITLDEIKIKALNNSNTLQTLLEHFPDELVKRNVFKHPIAGRITMYQTMQFIDEHLLHHARQVSGYLKENR
ncbi:MAG: DinB family protein [Fimbriimonadaceae bacterium]|nr:DinB family protein [Chitinophagales bacterium]